MARGVWLVACLLFVSACGPRESETPGELVIGAVLPLSGADAAVGRDVLTGLRLAAHSSEDLSITVREADGEGNPMASARRFRELVEEVSVQAIVGGWFASTARTLAAIADQDELPFLALSPLAVPPGADPGPGFLPLHRMESLGASSASFAFEDLATKRAGIVTLASNRASVALGKAFADVYEQLGGQTSWAMSPDDRGQLKRPPGPEQKVDVIFVAAPSIWALRAREAAPKSRGASLIFVSGWELASAPELSRTGASVYVSSFFTPEDPSPSNREFLAACEADEVEPNAAIALGWDAGRLLQLSALSGGVSRSGIRSSLRRAQATPGATGRLVAGVSGGGLDAPAICLLTEEGVEFVRRVEAPRIEAEAGA